MKNAKSLLKTLQASAQLLFQSYSALAFGKSVTTGALLCALSLIHPATGILGIVAFASVLFFARLIHSASYSLAVQNPVLLYNSLLVGLATGTLFEINILSVCVAMVAGVFTFVVTQVLKNAFEHYLALPVLNMPFALVASLIYLASVKYGSLSLALPTLPSFLEMPHIPLWLSGFFHSLGLLVFMPSDVGGLVVFMAFLWHSRIHALMILMGYFVGTTFHSLLVGNAHSVYFDPYNINYILTAQALGAYFLIPSMRSYLLAFLAVLVSTFFLDALSVFWALWHVPVFTFPFIFTTLLFLYALKTGFYTQLTRYFYSSPEESLDAWDTACVRSLSGLQVYSTLPSPFLPVSGAWTVYQGFDDDWTHQGLWKHAVDLVIENEKQHTFRNLGLDLDDYYCYKKPVLSPINGVVIEVQNEIHDNSVGALDPTHNWGNYLILYSDFGYYVQLAHLQEKSIQVAVGERVVVGQLLGRVGNSGYSAQPHLHFQVQTTAMLGAPTCAFRFSQTLENGVLIGNQAENTRGSGGFWPVKKSILESMTVSSKRAKQLSFVLDEIYRYQITDSHHQNENQILEFKVKMLAGGQCYFEDTYHGSALYFELGKYSFYCSDFVGSSESALRYVMMALPSIPLSDTAVEWLDCLPSKITKASTQHGLWLKSLMHSLYRSEGKWNLRQDQIGGMLNIQHLFKSEEWQILTEFYPSSWDKAWKKIVLKGPKERVITLEKINIIH